MPVTAYNLDGKQFGALTVLHRIPGRAGYREVRCVCGRTFRTTISHIRRNQTACAGCYVAGARARCIKRAGIAARILRELRDGGGESTAPELAFVLELNPHTVCVTCRRMGRSGLLVSRLAKRKHGSGRRERLYDLPRAQA